MSYLSHSSYTTSLSPEFLQDLQKLFVRVGVTEPMHRVDVTEPMHNVTHSIRNAIEESMRIEASAQTSNRLIHSLNNPLIHSLRPLNDVFSMSTTPVIPPSKRFSIFNQNLTEQLMDCSEDLKGLNDAPIPEDSIYRKLLACIPIIGIIPTVTNERSLEKKIMQTKKRARRVKLISIKNHYKIASIIREMLSVALIVARVSLTILSKATGTGIVMTAGIIGGSCAAFYAHGIYKNKQLINELQANKKPSSAIRVR